MSNCCFECGKALHYRQIGIGYCGECQKKPIHKAVCPKCGATRMMQYQSVKRAGGGGLCFSCRGKLARMQSTPEGRSRGVRKQWEGFRKDKERYSEICRLHSIRSKKMWANRGEKEKNRIIKALTKKISRSKVSNEFKRLLIRNGLYGGFKSEVIFHGFIPDETNNRLKIIIEFYGDIFHCNPLRYKDKGLFVRAIGRTVGEQWNRDRRRLACFYKHGYTVIIVWEKDYRSNKKLVIERIRNEIDKKKKALGILREMRHNS